jgi:hypothetical protein
MKKTKKNYGKHLSSSYFPFFSNASKLKSISFTLIIALSVKKSLDESATFYKQVLQEITNKKTKMKVSVGFHFAAEKSCILSLLKEPVTVNKVVHLFFHLS